MPDEENGEPAARHIVRVDDPRPNYGHSFLLYTDKERVAMRRLMELSYDDDAWDLVRWMRQHAREERENQIMQAEQEKWHATWWGRLAVMAAVIVALVDIYRAASGH